MPYNAEMKKKNFRSKLCILQAFDCCYRHLIVVIVFYFQNGDEISELIGGGPEPGQTLIMETAQGTEMVTITTNTPQNA